MIIVFLIIGALMIPALHSVNNFDNPYKVTKNSTSEATITVSETDLRKVYAGQTAASFNSAIAKNDTALALSFVCDASRTEASTELASLGSVTYKNKDGTTRTSQITNYEKYDSLELTGVSTNQTPIIQVTMRDLSNKGEVDYATYYVHTDSATDKQCISAVLYSDDNYDVSRSVAGFGQKE
jgi:hypothetical protein